jgi:hypothetical protein
LKQELTSPPRKPTLDEESFQQLLSAAHIIQEHNDKLLAKEPKAGSAETLAEIVETRKLVLTGDPDLRGAAGLIVARLLRITKSAGAAIGILDQNQLTYLAGSGSAAGENGEHVAVKSSLSSACLQTGKILRRPDVATGPQLAPEFRRDSAVRSLIAVPIHRETRIAGVVELRFAEINGFSEDDVYACELMAALMTEALARADELDKKEALAAEREAMLQILEKIKPQLEKLAGEPIPDLNKTASPEETSPPPPKSRSAKNLAAGLESVIAPLAAAPPKPATTAGRICRGCGKEFSADEAFCGKCGMTRSKPGGNNGHLQSKWASMWYMQQAAGQADVKREDERVNGKKSQETVAPGKTPAVLPPWPTTPQLASRKKEETAPPAPVSTAAAAPKEQPPPRLPVSLEEIVAQFAEESDLIPAPHVTEFRPPVAAEPILAGLAEAPEETIDWKLGPATEIELEAHRQRETSFQETSFQETGFQNEPEPGTAIYPEGANIFEDAPLVVRNPLSDDHSAVDETMTPAAEVTTNSTWSSAANARRWLDSVRGPSPRTVWLKEQWRCHHANIYLATAALIFVASLIGLFMQPAPVAHKNPAEAQLTAFEKLMVNLGLAEAPPTPVNLGNPDRQVWVDLHTALYYCPGSELYGKTAGGRYETQRSAQLDQFESASRRACD